MAHLESRCGRLSRKDSTSILERLPSELLQHIARQLPLSSAASLAFCSKSICSVVGRQYWHDLSSQTLEKETFLTLIEKNHPGHWLCHVCTILHPRPYQILEYNGIPPYGGRRRSVPGCIQDYGLFYGGLGNTGLNTWYPNFGPTLMITHPMIHLAMNRHLFGPGHGDSLDVFFKPLQEDAIDRINISTQACIIANEFYLRWQYRVVIPFSEGFDHVWKVSFGVCICPHVQTTLAQKDIITRISECMLSHRDTGSCEKCNRPVQCHSCLTEFEVSIHKLELIGHVLEITAWKNFGSGRSPKDPKWADHVWETAKNKVYPSLGDPFELSQGIIRSAFESHQSLETTSHFQSSPPESSIPVAESHQTITNPPHIFPENVQSTARSYDTVISPPKPPHGSFWHLVVNSATLAANKFKLCGESGKWGYKKGSYKGEEKNREKIVAEGNHLKFIREIALWGCI